MPASEYMGWIDYFAEKARQDEVRKGNIMAMNEDEVAEHFANGGKS